MTLTEALIRARSALRHRVAHLESVIECNPIPRDDEFFGYLEKLDLEAIEVIEKELSHDS